MISKILINITFLLFLNHSGVIGVQGFFKALSTLNFIKTSEVKDIYKLKYTGPDIEIACIHEEEMDDYARLETDGKNISLLIPKLQNGKDLILYFDHILGNRVKNQGMDWNFHKKWFTDAKKNICKFSYGFGKRSAENFDLLSKVKEMVNTHRIEFVAKIARDFVIGIGLELSRVEMVGFCFGAHIGCHACRYCNAAREKEGKEEKVKKFIGDADYVQLIHSNYRAKLNIFPFKLFKLGTSRMTGDVDILVKGIPHSDEHLIASDIFIATAIRKVVLVASRAPTTGKRYEYYSTIQERVLLGPDDVFIGIHDEKNGKKLGMFEITLQQQGELLSNSIEPLV